MSIEIYRQRIEKELLLSIGKMGEASQLRDACEYALTNGGKRMRPILVMMIADALGHGLDVSPAALSVEYLHTASLIADDLPCMDDDAMRRNRPSLHKVFGESVAILASYTLIAEGYGGIYRNSRLMKNSPSFAAQADSVAILCLELATRAAGIQGATNGQFLDLYPPDSTLETIQKIIVQKTVTLFEISFVFGWLFGGGSEDALERVQKCAYHLGMAFQIADDLQDDLQDASRASAINISAVCGKEKAGEMFEENIESLIVCLRDLKLWTPSFERVVDWLRQLVSQPVEIVK
jgi:geranylgeranyl diphosphate synthase type II